MSAFLNPADSTLFCKISRNGLEIRNDASDFESIRGTVSVSSGKAYYEVTIRTGG